MMMMMMMMRMMMKQCNEGSDEPFFTWQFDKYQNLTCWKLFFFPQGFAEIDPFLPIEVPNYSEKEVYSCLEYYMDRMWIQRPEGNS